MFTAFRESTDRVVEICIAEGWNVIRVDGRGWHYLGDYKFASQVDALEAFANKKYEKIVFVGHPESASLGISLSASSCLIFWSNVHKADDKWQASQRIHDLGMDKVRGAVIKEMFHLPCDLKVTHSYLKKVGLYHTVAGDSDS